MRGYKAKVSATRCRVTIASRRLIVVFGVGIAAMLHAQVSTGAVVDQAECPNESLRSALASISLPDCRAYEMVTPVFKEGYPMLMRSFASNGESAIIDSLATLVGTPGSTELLIENGLYLDTRTQGWRLTPMNPSLSEFVGQFPLAAEADDGDTLWEQHEADQPTSVRDLYVRSPNGVFHAIGPLSPLKVSEEEPSDVILSDENSLALPLAATSDYGHVVLLAKFAEARWPFDGTAGGETHSLYEYSGTGNKEPILVGVTGGKGDNHLIASCGTALGSSPFGSTYNALSRDGETIFFSVNSCGTAPATTEVYARIHGALTSAGSPETVDISESKCTEACSPEPSGKNYEGASEDGKRVFFTSTQKLTNDAVDGTESGNATEGGCRRIKAGKVGCNLYLYDFGAPSAGLRAVSVGGEVLGVVGVAEDGSRVYYVSRAALASAGGSPSGVFPVTGSPNIYVYDVESGRTSFIATLSGGGSEDEKDWLRNGGERTAQVAGKTGRFLLFASSTPGVTPDDVSTHPQLFEYKAEAEGEAAELERLSKGEVNFNENGNATTGVAQESIAVESNSTRDFKSTTDTLNITENGKTVFFVTRGELSQRATAATQGCTSLYEFHTTAALSEGSVHLISDGRDAQSFKGSCGAEFLGMDRTGTNVLFASSDPLTPADTDGLQRDIYDARIDGGFEPAPGAGADCAAMCEGQSSGGQSLTSLGSENGGSEPPGISGAPIRVSANKVAHKVMRKNGRSKPVRNKCRSKPAKRRQACKRVASKASGSKVRVSGSKRSR